MMATPLSPMVLFFGLGALAAFGRSDLTIPEAAGKAMAIGPKGDVAVAAQGFTIDLAVAASSDSPSRSSCHYPLSGSFAGRGGNRRPMLRQLQRITARSASAPSSQLSSSLVSRASWPAAT